jgi:ATP-binding cassette, subfamily G (WHITE), member 2, PDR
MFALRVNTDRQSGIPQLEMIKHFRGELVYNADVDQHFPHLTVGETLQFAAAMRARSDRLVGASRAENIERLTAVVMAICGLTHTRNTKVGNDFVRGVSGGERKVRATIDSLCEMVTDILFKRVSIAEMMLAWSPIGAWDNSTRGLDSATALAFVNNLKLGADVLGTAHVVAIYQASQAIFDVFDKVIVLYEGREIFFGPTSLAHAYFTDMGWLCPPRQTTGDFCTSVTNHQERKARPGFEHKVPRTPQEFEAYWHASQAYKILQSEIDAYQNDSHNAEYAGKFRAMHEASQSSYIRGTSSYMVSLPMQVKICTKRAYQRLWNDKASTLTVVLGQIIMALVVGSVFFGTPDNTNSFFARGSTLFFATLLNALIAVTEINNLYQQRPIVQKHVSFA